MSLTHWPSTLCVAVSPLTTFDNRVTSQGSSLAPKPTFHRSFLAPVFCVWKLRLQRQTAEVSSEYWRFRQLVFLRQEDLVTKRQFNLVAVENASRSQ